MRRKGKAKTFSEETQTPAHFGQSMGCGQSGRKRWMMKLSLSLGIQEQ